MATETATPSAPTAQVIGNAFVEQYYHILHKSPESVHRFYQESSVLSRPELNGLVTTVTTMQEINNKICSFDYKKYTAEIKTADSQDSHKDGVIVLVTGTLTGPDNVKKNFTQTFFLAPQDKGYFVLNDIFRYVEDNNVSSLENSKVTDNGAHDSFVPPTHEPEPAQVVDSPTVDSSTSHIEEVQNIEQRVKDLSDERESIKEREVVLAPEPQTNKKNISEITESASHVTLEDAPKKSYASILNSQTKKGILESAKIHVPTNNSKVAPTKIEKKAVASVAHPEISAPSATVVESKENQDAEGHSIYVHNLPLNVLAPEVEMEFKKFGPIKQGGVQVRINKIHGSCFGFVEFQSLSSMNDAIKASPVTIGGREVIVEIKRTTTTRAGNGRGRFPSGRGGFRNDSFRGRGENYVNGQGYVRNEYTNRRDFNGRGRVTVVRGGQIYQQGRGQGGRQGGSIRVAEAT